MNFQESRWQVVAFLWLIGLLIPTVACGEAGDAAKGESVFKNFCVMCHGPQGKGDGPAAKGLTPPPANLTSEDVRQDPDEELLGIIRNGKPGTAMPPWKTSLSEQQILDVLAYVRSLSQ